MPTSCRRAARAIFGTIPSTAKVCLIATRGLLRNSTARAPTTRSSRVNSFAGGPNKGDRTCPAAELVTVAVRPGKAGLETADRQAKVWVAIVAVRVAAEEPVAPAQASSAVAAVAAARFKAWIAAAARRAAPASAAALVGVASVAAELPEVAVVVAAAVVVVEEDAAGNLVSGVRFRLNQDMEEWNVGKMAESSYSTISYRDSMTLF